MSGDPSSRRLGLVVAASDAEREECCRELIRHGYAVVGFADSANAAAWLEEETPVVAIVTSEVKDEYGSLMAVLAERDVLLPPTKPDGKRSLGEPRAPDVTGDGIAAARRP